VPILRGGSKNQQKEGKDGDDNKASCSQKSEATCQKEVGNRTAPGEAGRAEEQMV
jgi:hypothetical protein